MPGRDAPASIANRYQVRRQLGRGGMAVVYEVHDPVRGIDVALKQLLAQRDLRVADEVHARFEREFHTLSELAHPRIIQVYDYGLDETGPFYTMELLDGGDLAGRTPVPWRDACMLLHDVCSSLALLHSRRLVHCDVTPRNVRCTRDGQAKLIDFGAMAPMGPCTLTAGTPSFTAPEMVARGDLDGRSDLFSLGATFYYALTGRVPFAARDFGELVIAFRVKPRAPSHFVPGIPEALDRLVMSLLGLQPDERPRNAFEVMERLAGIAGIAQREAAEVSAAYLSTPQLVGRSQLTAALDSALWHAANGEGCAIGIYGSAGLGRSRVLAAAAMAARLHGACVLRAGADAGREDFAVARALCEQLCSNLPAARADAPKFEGPRGEIQDAVLRFFRGVAATQALALAVDDLDRIDEASAALIAQCAGQCAGVRLALIATLGTEPNAVTREALSIFARDARHFELTPLAEADTIALLTSLFGDVPNVATVGRGVHAIAAGNPRLTMELARHLVDTQCVRYAAGSWTLPEQLGAGDLPQSADRALRARVQALNPLARWLLEAQALATHEAFTRENYILLAPNESATRIDQAVRELVADELIVTSGRVYSLAHRSGIGALTAHLSDEEKRSRHVALAGVYGDTLQSVFHWFAAGEYARGIDLLLAQFQAMGDSIDVFATLHITAWELVRLFDRALDVIGELDRPPRDVAELQRLAAGYAVASEDRYYWRAAPPWLERLRADSGLAIWESLTHVTDPGARLTQALTTAFERYNATPERERVYRPDEAIKNLCTYVVASIAIGARSCDGVLVDSLPALLAPFAPLSPAVATIHQNACATREARCLAQPERARARWLEVYARIEHMTEAEIRFVGLIRRAVAAGIGAMEAMMGLPGADRWADLIEQDHLQAVQAMYLRRVVALQQGDWAQAEVFRKRSEELSLKTRARPMFTSTQMIELAAHALAADLTGVKQLKDRIDQIAAGTPTWRPNQLLAEGIYLFLCGEMHAALAKFEECAAVTAPIDGDPAPFVPLWPLAIAGVVEVLIELNRAHEAVSRGTRALERCTQFGIDVGAHELMRTLALAEAKAGKIEVAVERIDRLIEAQVAFGITGLVLGASYETRARIAILARDEAAAMEFAKQTARQYRRGAGSPLGARYERLMDEARVAFPQRITEFAPFDLAIISGTSAERTAASETIVTQVLRQGTTREERAALALSLLCENRGVTEGYLYLASPSGLRLAASQSSVVAPAALVTIATQFLTAQATAVDFATQVESEPPAPDAGTLAIPVSPNAPPGSFGSLMAAEREYEPIVLSSWNNGEMCYVGIALLATRVDGARRTIDARLNAAIAHALLAAGDSTGFSA